MEHVFIEGATNDMSSAKKYQSKKGAKQRVVCLGKVCIRNKNIVEAFIGNNTIYGFIIFNTGCVLIALGSYNILSLQFGTTPNTVLIFAIIFFVILLISGTLFGRFEN